MVLYREALAVAQPHAEGHGMAGAAAAAVHGLPLKGRRRHAYGRRHRSIDGCRRRRGPLLRAAEDKIQEPFGAGGAGRDRERNNDEHTEKHSRARYSTARYDANARDTSQTREPGKVNIPARQMRYGWNCSYLVDRSDDRKSLRS